MGEVILGVMFAVIVTVATFMRESLSGQATRVVSRNVWKSRLHSLVVEIGEANR